MKFEFEWLTQKDFGLVAFGIGYVFADGKISFGFLLGIFALEIVFKDRNSTSIRLPDDYGKIVDGSSINVEL